MNKKNKNDKILFTIAIVVVFIALVNLGITFYKFGGVDKLTGRATSDTGIANLSIQSVVAVNFTTNLIDWGNGAVTAPFAYATLDSSNDTKTNWNGSSNNVGLILQNDGNVNAMINLSADKTAATFIGGSTPLFQIQAVNVSSSEGCMSAPESTYWNGNSTSRTYCSNLSYMNSYDSIRINVRVAIPSDAGIGTKTTTITATALGL